MIAGLRAGYKQTEVGVIPEDWDVKRLGDIATIATGNTPPTRDAANYGDEFLFVSPADLGDEKHVIDTQKRLSKKGFSLSRCFPKGSILFVCIGSTIGKCGVASIELTTNQQINSIFPASTFSTDYLYYTVCAAAPKVRALAGEQAVPIVNKTQFSQTAVSIPPLPEQRAIASALSDVDALLAKLDEFIAKKRDLKQAAMQQLLTGQTRLPGFSGEWEARPLASIVANLEAGVSVNSVEHCKPLSSGEPCILKTSAIFDGRFDPEECKLVDRRDISRAKLSPRRDTIIISRMNTPNLVGEVGYVPADFPTLNLPDRLWMTRFDTGADICPRWLAYVMSSAHVKETIKGLATGTSGSMKNIGKSVLLALQLNFPTGQEQTAIATILSDMDTELAALEARSDKTRALKQGMMQELLTGRIRLV